MGLSAITAAGLPVTPTGNLGIPDEGGGERDAYEFVSLHMGTPYLTLWEGRIGEKLPRIVRVFRCGAYLSPVHDGYAKPHLLPSTERLDMPRLASDNSSWMMVDSWECIQTAPSPSYAVAHHLLSVSALFENVV